MRRSDGAATTGTGRGSSAAPALAARWTRWVAGIVTAVVVAYVGWRAFAVGVDVRQKIWEGTNGIRVDGDIAAGFANGEGVLREAERREAKLTHQPRRQIAPPPQTWVLSPPLTWAEVKRRIDQRLPLYRQLLRGYTGYYDRRVVERPNGEYDVDYPPLRLGVMTLWAWHVQAQHPEIHGWDGTRKHEPIAAPVLGLNTACSAIAAAAAFFLVWYWVAREGRAPPPPAARPSLYRRWRDRRGRSRQRPPVASVPDAIDLREVEPLWRIGDPWLLAPAVALVVWTSLRWTWRWESVVEWDYWVGVVLRFTAVVALARILPRPLRGPACGLVAAILLWLNPGLLLDSHVWPQWDSWLLPAFMLAALFASVDWWFTAGACLGAGAMMKGQVLLVAPLLVLWPVFEGRWGRAARFATGMALTAGLIVWPWIIRNDAATTLVLAATGGAALVALLALFRRPLARAGRAELAGLPWERLPHHAFPLLGRSRPVARFPYEEDETTEPDDDDDDVSVGRGAAGVAHLAILGACLVGALVLLLKPAWAQTRTAWVVAGLCVAAAGILRLRSVLWVAAAMAVFAAVAATVWYRPAMPAGARWPMVLLALGVGALPWVVRKRSLPFFVAAVAAAAIWIAAFHLDGNFSWYRVGFEYGARRQQVMALGMLSNSNLASLLEVRFGWHLHDPYTFNVPPLKEPVTMEIRSFLATWYFVLLALIAAGAAVHSRRNDSRVLVALAAPMILFPAILTQMSARYILYGASISAIVVGTSVGLSLLHLLLAGLAFTMIGHQLVSRDPSFAFGWFNAVSRTWPDVGWMRLLIAAVFVYVAVVPRRWRFRVGRARPAREIAAPAAPRPRRRAPPVREPEGPPDEGNGYPLRIEEDLAEDPRLAAPLAAGRGGGA